jgi:hypothetical protein
LPPRAQAGDLRGLKAASAERGHTMDDPRQRAPSVERSRDLILEMLRHVGLRGFERVSKCAILNGFSEPEIVETPANNLSLLLRRRAARGDT